MSYNALLKESMMYMKCRPPCLPRLSSSNAVAQNQRRSGGILAVPVTGRPWKCHTALE